MILYFLRHGRADRSEWAGNDFERPLTKKGKLLMAQTADTIAELNFGLDLILTSPLLRALQTAEIVAKNLQMEGRMVVDARLGPGFDTDVLADMLLEHPDAANVMLVGHEPDFSLTIGALIGGARVVMKKGGLARIDIMSSATLAGELAWLIPPKALTR
jgi:phosphohistidine phosphatase